MSRSSAPVGILKVSVTVRPAAPVVASVSVVDSVFREHDAEAQVSDVANLLGNGRRQSELLLRAACEQVESFQTQVNEPADVSLALERLRESRQLVSRLLTDSKLRAEVI